MLTVYNYIKGEQKRLLIGNDGHPVLREVPQDEILARQELNRQLSINSNKRIWAKQALLGRKGKAHHAPHVSAV